MRNITQTKYQSYPTDITHLDRERPQAYVVNISLVFSSNVCDKVNNIFRLLKSESSDVLFGSQQLFIYNIHQ